MLKNEVSMHLILGRVSRAGNLFQYDYGQRLVFHGVTLPEAYEVHFSHGVQGQSKTMIGDSTGVDIPDEYLLSGEEIHVWVYLHAGQTDGETVYHGIIGVTKRAQPTDQEPTPVQQSEIDQAISALASGVAQVESIADGIPQTIDEALAEAKASGEFDGKDGHSPEVTANKTGKTTTVSVDGEPVATILDGEDGDPGHSPVLTASKSGKTTTVYSDGVQLAQIMDGEDGTPVIDDSSTALDKVWSAHKTDGEVSALRSALNTITPSEYSSSSTYAVGDLCWHENAMYRCNTAISTAEAWTVAHWTQIAFPRDVRVNGTTVVDANGVANVPLALDGGDAGVVKIVGSQGIGKAANNALYIVTAAANHIKAGTNELRPITPKNQNESVFYGLAKAAGADMASSSNPVGTFTEAAKKAIRKMLGIPNTNWELIADVTVNADSTEIAASVDTNGLAFKLQKLVAVFNANQSTTGTRDSFYGIVYFRATDGFNKDTSFPSMTYANTTSKMASRIEIEACGNCPIHELVATGTSEGQSSQTYMMQKGGSFAEYITGFKIYQSASDKSLIPSGANLKVYGIRYDD